MKYVVVRHEEQMTEDAYVLNEGTAYVPLFSERDLVLFQDENETRYARVNCATSRYLRIWRNFYRPVLK